MSREGESFKNIEKWDLRFLQMAKLVSIWSKDPRKKCGVVIVRPDRTVASVGYNGFPRGVHDTADHLYDREEKLARVIHAEVNAILSAKEPLDMFTLYQWPGASCSHCASMIIQSGISRVVWPGAKEHESQWLASQKVGFEMFDQAGVEYDAIAYP